MIRLILIALAVWAVACSAAVAAGTTLTTHNDPIAPVILGVTGVLFFAILGRFAARKLNQPSVLGEVIVGIAVGNLLYWLGVDLIAVLREGAGVFEMVELALAGEPWDAAAAHTIGNSNAAHVLDIIRGPYGGEILQVAQTVDIFSRYGVIFLLFLVGLDTSMKELRSTGGDSLRVALIGVIAPFLFGFVMARLLMPEASFNVDLFVAATLGATSVGISASVLQELNQVRSRTAHIILGAAVIDDVLGLVMLAVISGIIVAGGLDMGNLLSVIVISGLFLVSAFALGPYFLNISIRLVRHLDMVEAKLFTSFLFVMVLAWFANLAGLATIVGAFAAGLIMHDGYFKHWGDYNKHRLTIKDLVAPLEAILVPIFFILMGIQVKLETFFDWHVILVSAGLLVAAVLGKLVSGLGVTRGNIKLAVGFGMMPRGEVGLIFASIGKTLGVINDALFSSIVLMVIVTTLAAPPLLKWSIRRHEKIAAQ